MKPPKRPRSAGNTVSARLDQLVAKVEWLEGAVRQLLAERTSDAITRPTWKDIQTLRAEIETLSRRIENR